MLILLRSSLFEIELRSRQFRKALGNSSRRPPQDSEIACIDAGSMLLSRTVPQSTFGSYLGFVNRIWRVSTGFFGFLWGLSAFWHSLPTKTPV
jgi:hypothetical protein